MSLHIGLNLFYWTRQSGGSGTYARELIRALHAVEPGTRVTAWVGRDAPAGIDGFDWGGETTFVHVPLASTNSPVHLAYELGLLGFDARRRGVDVIHGLAYSSPLIAPGVPTVLTILDLTWRHDPTSVSWRARTMFGLLTAACGRRADRIVAISEAVRADLVHTAGLPAHKIDVTPLGATATASPASDPSRLRARLELPATARIVLFVGQLAAHKNLPLLLHAARALPADACVVLAGRETRHAGELRALATRLGIAERIVFAGFVDDADLEALYAMADVLVLPSTHEGYGLTVLEAMSRGVPVACSQTAALKEVAGGAALLFDPHSVASLHTALERVLTDPSTRTALVDRGRARAASLTWEVTARETFASYRRAMS